MTRNEIINYIWQTYQVKPEYLWEKYPDFAVFRHSNKKAKWFAILMTVTPTKLGLKGKEKIAIINLKCDPAVIDGLRQDPDIFPAYHMNKTHWFSLAFERQFPESQIKHLIDWSFHLTEN